ncbi:replication protein A 70 kDa DNA-binding subunit E [Lactuca sativa]|uniref:Replication factor A C-terminal domain-containing protein n=1 Tax=Lactuca sativa TaxID=4236 RepID=A0A9R1XC99_LACSA|nr:replication protein A 70 kDa DNA-binding subunit E [Lactuca sativa]KAJ0207054.1 hypothetical protein LSAT_V11C500249870 [Lactuca sativa]
MAVNLTAGAIWMLSTGEWQTMDLKPVLQVIDILAFQTQTPTEGGEENMRDRYRVLLSDGYFHRQGVLSANRSELVTSQQLQKGSIVKLTKFLCITIRERILIKIIDLNVILGGCDIIGDPKPFPHELPSNNQFIWKTLTQIKDEKLGTFGNTDYITVNATIWYIKRDNFCYTTCPIMLGDRKCSKRVVNNGDGRWICKKCDQIVDECDYRYDLQLHIHDHTGLTWVNAYEETGEEIMGVSAKDLYLLKHEDEDEDAFMEVVHGVLFSEYKFKLKVKEEFLGDEARVRSIVVKAEKIKYSSNTKNLLVRVSSVSNV